MNPDTTPSEAAPAHANVDPVAALAALRDGRRYRRRDEQPRKLKLDTGLSLELPGPRLLASTFALPWLSERREPFRVGSAILARPSGTTDEPTVLDLVAVASDLRDALTALPNRSDAGRPYNDLRLFIAEAMPETVAAYLRETVAAIRMLSPVWRPTKQLLPRGPKKSQAEIQARYRARVRAAEAASARWWLAVLDPEDLGLTPGARIAAADLYASAKEALEDLEGENLDDDDPDAGSIRVPGPHTFYRVADEVLGPRHRGRSGVRTYRLPGD